MRYKTEKEEDNNILIKIVISLIIKKLQIQIEIIIKCYKIYQNNKIKKLKSVMKKIIKFLGEIKFKE